jgi:hypothetical protein
MQARRWLVAAYLKKFAKPTLPPGGQAHLARLLGVTKSVITHDIRFLQGRPYHYGR